MLDKMEYPGRGIVVGRSKTGTHAITAYFVMGRSDHSRNRYFALTADGIRTQAVDPAKMVDPSLVIYHPVRRCGPHIIVTNGDQTDTIVKFLEAGETFADALRTRTFEPDAPHFTPRISGMLSVSASEMSYQLSILKSAAGNPDSVERFFYEYPQPLAGEAHFIHTYRDVIEGEAERLSSFAGEPISLSLPDGSIDELSELLWSELSPDHRISLYVAFLDLATGEQSVRLINRFHPDKE